MNKLTDKDYCEIAEFLGCSVAAIKAVAAVESGGRGGFDGKGRVLIRFEGHKFRKYTGGRHNQTHPLISYRYHRTHRNCGVHHGYTGFNQAFALDKIAAMKSCSIGMFQPMVFNYHEMGYKSEAEMWGDFRRGEREQLYAFSRLIKNWGLDDELRRAGRSDFENFARLYNGSDYKANDYHTKMWDNFLQFSKQHIDCTQNQTAHTPQPNSSDHLQTGDLPSGNRSFENNSAGNFSENSADAPPDEHFDVFSGTIFDQVSNQIEDFADDLKDDTGTVSGEISERTKETTQTARGKVEKTVEETTSTFNPKNIPAYIPRFGKQWLWGLIPGSGFISTLVAYAENAPQWLVFLIGALTGIALWNFASMIINHRAKVLDFIRDCYVISANPEMDNLIPTNARRFAGQRQENMKKSLENNSVKRLAELYDALPMRERVLFKEKYL